MGVQRRVPEYARSVHGIAGSHVRGERASSNLKAGRMKVAVMLSGCGVHHGAEIDEAVVTLLAPG